jgi:cell division protein FtsW (lipid II flippase)
MNRFWKQLALATNWPLVVAVAVLSAAGLLCIWVDSPPDGSKQLVFLALGFVLMIGLQSFHYLRIGRLAWFFYAVSLLLVFYTDIGKTFPVPGVVEKNGAYSWIVIGPASLEPSELMKLSFVMVLARYLRFRSNYRTVIGLITPFALAVVPILMILRQPDLGVAAIFVPTLLAMLFVAGAKVRHILAVIGLGIALLPVVWFSGDDMPFFRHLPPLLLHKQRVEAMFHDDTKTQQGVGLQQRLALMAMSSGWTGKGVGNIPVGKHIPEARNDMIFALIGEQFGLAGSIIVLIAYMVLFAAGIEIAAATREPFGRLVALGIVSFLAAQTFLNLLVTVRLFPVTGVTLPFVSSGGSSLLASFLSIGLLLNIGQNRPLVIARDSFEYD